ncbi:unnamed protein product, partial [Prorocentrum cordatum]
ETAACTKNMDFTLLAGTQNVCRESEQGLVEVGSELFCEDTGVPRDYSHWAALRRELLKKRIELRAPRMQATDLPAVEGELREKMAEMQDRRFVQLETQMGDLSAKQTALQQDQKEMQASIEKILKIIAEAEASIPTPLPTNGSNWERDLGPTIFKLSCAELFTTTEALKSIEEWIGELGIQRDQCYVTIGDMTIEVLPGYKSTKYLGRKLQFSDANMAEVENRDDLDLAKIYDIARYDPRFRELALEDIKRFRKYVRKASKRRAVPDGTAPLELSWQMLHPDAGLEGLRAGLGAQRAPVEPTFFFEVLLDAFMKAGWSFGASLKDMSNAFGSTSWTAMGAMGDPFMVAAFSATFQRRVQQWAESLRAADPSLHLLRAEWQGQEVDLSFFKYADDLYRYTLIAQGDLMGPFLAKLRSSDDLLDSHLQVRRELLNIGFTVMRSCCFGVTIAPPGLKAACLALCPRGPVRFVGTPRLMAELTPPAWTQAMSETKRGAGEGPGSEEKPSKHAKGGAKGDRNEKDFTKALMLFPTKLCLTSARELANLAGAVHQARGPLETSDGATQLMIDSGLKYDEMSRQMKERQRAGEKVDFRARGPPRVQLWAAVCLNLVTNVKRFIQGGKEEYAETEANKFNGYFAKYIQSAAPQTAGNHALHFRHRKHKGRKTETSGSSSQQQQMKKGRLTFAFGYKEPGMLARELIFWWLNYEEDQGRAEQLIGPAPK